MKRQQPCSSGAGPRGRQPYDRQPGHHPPRGVRGARSEHGRCNICSYTQDYDERQVPIFHRHFSSLRLRMLTNVETENKRYLCPTCKSFHLPYPDPEDRVKIIVSDSTLHEFFAPPSSSAPLYAGDTMHVDYITIAGADIKTLGHAFKLDYFDRPQTRPLDVVMVAGYNDMVAGNSRYTITDHLRSFCDLVKLSGLRLHPDKPNSVAISTLMYPPQLSWFPDNGAYPYPGYQNHKEKIDWINNEIDKLNTENNVPKYPALHTYGVRTNTLKNTDIYGNITMTKVKVHRWEHWREQEKGNMLHLRDDRRYKMATALNNYFTWNT